MSKIKDLLLSDDTVLVFDVDGVLAKLEFGKYNHFETDDVWYTGIDNDINFYTEDKVIKKMQDFIKTKNINNIYVITVSKNEKEANIKREYLIKNYNILKENIYFCLKNINKKDKLKLIKDKYKNLEDYKIVMIDDTVEILNDIMDNTNFSTVHISSFLDI